MFMCTNFYPREVPLFRRLVDLILRRVFVQVVGCNQAVSRFHDPAFMCFIQEVLVRGVDRQSKTWMKCDCH